MIRIKKGDLVYVITGRDRGKKGKVLRVFPREERAIVERINLVKRHLRRRRADRPGGIIEKEAPIDLSNIMLLCSSCNRPTRVGITILKDGTKARICKRCKELI